jgi:hypothetical protein
MKLKTNYFTLWSNTEYEIRDVGGTFHVWYRLQDTCNVSCRACRVFRFRITELFFFWYVLTDKLSRRDVWRMRSIRKFLLQHIPWRLLTYERNDHWFSNAVIFTRLLLYSTIHIVNQCSSTMRKTRPFFLQKVYFDDFTRFIIILSIIRAGIAQSVWPTGYRLDDQGVGVRVPVGARIITSPCSPDRL